MALCKDALDALSSFSTLVARVSSRTGSSASSGGGICGRASAGVRVGGVVHY